MQYISRAAALAAAAFCLVSATGFAEAGFATETAAAPAIPYTQHAASEMSADDLGLNPLPADEVPASSPTPTPVAAVAPALPEAPETPEVRGDRSLAELVADLGATEAPDAETDCLARAVYFESKGEPLTGQLTVAEVIINRARSGRFPSSLCGVVRQAGQFSFVRGGRIPTPPASARDWRVAVGIARVAMEELAEGAAPRALFFHARHASPGWRLTRVATVGNHVFYR